MEVNTMEQLELFPTKYEVKFCRGCHDTVLHVENECLKCLKKANDDRQFTIINQGQPACPTFI